MTSPGVVHRHTPPERSWFAVGRVDPSRATCVAELLASLGTGRALRRHRVREVDEARQQLPRCSCRPRASGCRCSTRSTCPACASSWSRPGRRRSTWDARSGTRPCRSSGSPRRISRRRGASSRRCSTCSTTGSSCPGATTTVLQDWRRAAAARSDDLNGTRRRRGRPSRRRDAREQRARRGRPPHRTRRARARSRATPPCCVPRGDAARVSPRGCAASRPGTGRRMPRCRRSATRWPRRSGSRRSGRRSR